MITVLWHCQHALHHNMWCSKTSDSFLKPSFLLFYRNIIYIYRLHLLQGTICIFTEGIHRLRPLQDKLHSYEREKINIQDVMLCQCPHGPNFISTTSKNSSEEFEKAVSMPSRAKLHFYKLKLFTKWKENVCQCPYGPNFISTRRRLWA